MSDPVLPAAGWFADPEGPPLERWWDGAAWTAHTRETPAQPPAAMAAEPAAMAAEPAAAEPAAAEAAVAEPAVPDAAPAVLAPIPPSQARPQPLLPGPATGRRSTYQAGENEVPLPWRHESVVEESEPRQRNVFALWALVFGVLAVLASSVAHISVVALAFPVLALAAGIAGLARARTVHSGVKRSAAGVLLAVISAVLVVVLGTAL